MGALINPDCRDGKHRSCAGAGWDDINGEPIQCPCTCHTTTAPRTECDLWAAGEPSTRQQEILDFINHRKGIYHERED